MYYHLIGGDFLNKKEKYDDFANVEAQRNCNYP